MKTDIPFVPIPPEFAALAGTPDKGTRIYRSEGDHFAMKRWFWALCENIGPCVSPGGAAVYAGVTRAGVYRRMQAGKLTAFCFHIIGKKKTLFGGEKKLKRWPVVYIPVSECKAWDEELDYRAAKIEAAKHGEESSGDVAALEEADPGIDNPDPAFVNYDPKDKGKGVRYLDRFWDEPYKMIPSPSLDEMEAFEDQLRAELKAKKAKEK